MKQPVYSALGELSTRHFERGAQTLSKLFPNMKVEAYEGRSHFERPFRTQPERFAGALQELCAHSVELSP